MTEIQHVDRPIHVPRNVQRPCRPRNIAGRARGGKSPLRRRALSPQRLDGESRDRIRRLPAPHIDPPEVPRHRHAPQIQQQRVDIPDIQHIGPARHRRDGKGEIRPRKIIVPAKRQLRKLPRRRRVKHELAADERPLGRRDGYGVSQGVLVARRFAIRGNGHHSRCDPIFQGFYQRYGTHGGH